MEIMRYETASRYYCAALYKDLFGTWIVAKAYGGRRNNLGNIRYEPVASEEEGKTALAAIAQRRAKRHYVPVRKLPC